MLTLWSCEMFFVTDSSVSEEPFTCVFISAHHPLKMVAANPPHHVAWHPRRLCLYQQEVITKTHVCLTNEWPYIPTWWYKPVWSQNIVFLYMKLRATFVMYCCIVVSTIDSEVLVQSSCILHHKTCHDSITLQGYAPNMFSPLYKLCIYMENKLYKVHASFHFCVVGW